MRFSPVQFMRNAGPLARLFQRYTDADHHVQLEMLRACDDYRDEIPLSAMYRIDPALTPGSLPHMALYAGFVRQSAPKNGEISSSMGRRRSTTVLRVV